MTVEPTDYIADAITEAFGERCPDYAEGCPICDAWAQYDELTELRALAISSASEVEATLSTANTEIARCHARLEIDHAFRAPRDGEEPDEQGFVRFEIPIAERAWMPDAVECRDATISLLEDEITKLRAKAARARDALEEARAFIADGIESEGEHEAEHSVEARRLVANLAAAIRAMKGEPG